ncbi:hypothetical protein L615_006400000040 [Nocardioides sp. J9]|uniref:hypothetical protein n=1 Tax=Nocardioides sp. J9 TaxID=935844 RepID=UPI0011A57716|nr:hypothetical protein [Nocardioides sp. J9]TWG93222.1 hypothetical protein L615_006400000040 [Nocardioides sp. J9]
MRMRDVRCDEAYLRAMRDESGHAGIHRFMTDLTWSLLLDVPELARQVVDLPHLTTSGDRVLDELRPSCRTLR